MIRIIFILFTKRIIYTITITSTTTTTTSTTTTTTTTTVAAASNIITGTSIVLINWATPNIKR